MRVILGHNQFIGISHISESRSREREQIFSKIENIYKVVEAASKLGYKSMIIETHPRMLEFVEYYKKNKTFDMDFYLQTPYAQGYIQKMNEQGIIGLISDIVTKTGFVGASSLVLRGAVNLIAGDPLAVAISALKLEVAPFDGINIKALLLHNIITDLALSLRISDAFSEYENYVRDKLGYVPGYITLNFPLFRKCFEEWHLSSPLVMTPVNPQGYDMNPSRDIVENALKSYHGDIIAMNVLGGGAFPVTEAAKYLKSFDSVKQCVIGASSRNHLKESLMRLGENSSNGLL
jgi:hypothetical protein